MKKCPALIQEMVVCVSQLIMLAHAGRLSRMPSLSTLEGCMKLSAMVVQGLWECKSPLLQLPHISEDNLKYFSSKRHQVCFYSFFFKSQENVLNSAGNSEKYLRTTKMNKNTC